MIPTSSAEQVLQTLAGFKAYAAGTLLVLELAGTFVFALSGAAAGVKHRLDLFGVLVVSCATATAGGITRDVLDRKSTRLNSSHRTISYAVFCLKKKKN